MKNLRRKFNRFCFQNRDKGIPNLMLYVSLGSALVYVLSMYDNSYTLYSLLCFDREMILQGQIWRLVTYALTYDGGNIVYTALGLVCYYSLGRAMENLWGTLRFNLYYFTCIILMDIYGLLFPGFLGINYVSVYYLNLSLFLSYATLYPNSQFLLFFVIPVKAWIFALIDLVLTLYDVISMSIPDFLFPYNLFPLIALANYFLFFGKDVLNVIPVTWRVNFNRLFRKGKAKVTKTDKPPKVIPFPNAGSYEATIAKPKAPYTHRCTVCGRTDTDSPDLEFRYCSRCKGYYCYCIEHINNHTHIQ